MNPVGASLTILFSLIVFIAPRRWAILGVLAGVCYITQGQTVDVGGFHFTAIRIIALVGFIRIVVRGELTKVRLNNLDIVLIAFTLTQTVICSLRLGVWQEQVGFAYNVLLSYFVFRGLVTNWEELEELMNSMALFIIPLALCMVMESMTGKNVFNMMGGQEDASMREGRYRCIGSFRGPHTSGTFGATLMPMFVGLFFLHPKRRPITVMGLVAATVITYTANASGPLMAYLSAIVGLVFWRLRMNMKRVRQGIVAGLVILGFTMKAPIWYIFAKISDITGGDGWYRSRLMEQCFNHISDWWLMGTNDTSDWAATLMSWGGADLCNLYVSTAANAGLAGLVLIILLLVLCFRYLGLALAEARTSVPEAEVILWCLGTALFAHVVTLFSVTYFDQLHVIWWGTLAIISSVSTDLVARSTANERVAEDSSSLSLEPVPGENAYPPPEPDAAECHATNDKVSPPLGHKSDNFGSMIGRNPPIGPQSESVWNVAGMPMKTANHVAISKRIIFAGMGSADHDLRQGD